MSFEFNTPEMDISQAGSASFISITGKLEKSDYEVIVPMLESGIEKHGKINILLELRDFKGWSAGALWEDTKFGVRHFSDIAHLAIIGDRKWEKNLARFAKVFTRAEVRYFDQTDTVSAYDWINTASTI